MMCHLSAHPSLAFSPRGTSNLPPPFLTGPRSWHGSPTFSFGSVTVPSFRGGALAVDERASPRITLSTLSQRRCLLLVVRRYRSFGPGSVRLPLTSSSQHEQRLMRASCL